MPTPIVLGQIVSQRPIVFDGADFVVDDFSQPIDYYVTDAGDKIILEH